MEIPAYIREHSSGTLQCKDVKLVFRTLFANYDARYVKTNDRGFVKEYLIGRGSLGLLARIESHVLDENMSPILEIGRMCNAGHDSTILIDGEHKNGTAINIDMTQFPESHGLLREQNKISAPMETKGKTVIGSGVLISRGVTILSGVRIGNGAVIGAEAVVTKDVPAFSIVAGNPAKVLRYRFDKETIEKMEAIRWWDFEYYFLFSNLPRIQRMNMEEFVEAFGDTSKNKYVTSKDRFVFQIINSRHDCDVMGCDLDGEYVPYDSLNEGIQFYLDQMLNYEKEPVHLVKNILDCR